MVPGIQLGCPDLWFLANTSVPNENGFSVRQWSGRPGFNPRSRHTKDFKNGTWYLFA